jgi:hypothetical protein
VAKPKTAPDTSWLKEVMRAPVVALNAARWSRATSPEPAAAPGGRTDVKSPPMYTTPLAYVIARTTPFVCHELATLPGTVPFCTADAGTPGTTARPAVPATRATGAARILRIRIYCPFSACA